MKRFMRCQTTVCTVMILFILLAESCSLANEKPTITSSVSTPVIVNQSSTPTPFLLPSIFTATLHPTSTNLPLVLANDGKRILANFIQNNGGCELPCLFGLIPGKSKTIDARSLISFFAMGSSINDNENESVEVNSYMSDKGYGGFSTIFWNNRLRTQINFSYYGNDTEIDQIDLSSESWLHSGQGANEGATINYDNAYYSETLKFYSLSQVLSTYGPPQQIVILPFPDDPGHPSPPAQYPFSIALHYPDKGFLIEYSFMREKKNGNYIGCPTKSHITISAWDSSKSISLDDAVKYFSGIYGINPATVNYFKQIQDVTNMDVTSFYEVFKVETDKCIQTPTKFWPPNP